MSTFTTEYYYSLLESFPTRLTAIANAINVQKSFFETKRSLFFSNSISNGGLLERLVKQIPSCTFSTNHESILFDCSFSFDQGISHTLLFPNGIHSSNTWDLEYSSQRKNRIKTIAEHTPSLLSSIVDNTNAFSNFHEYFFDISSRTTLKNIPSNRTYTIKNYKEYNNTFFPCIRTIKYIIPVRGYITTSLQTVTANGEDKNTEHFVWNVELTPGTYQVYAKITYSHNAHQDIYTDWSTYVKNKTTNSLTFDQYVANYEFIPGFARTSKANFHVNTNNDQNTCASGHLGIYPHGFQYFFTLASPRLDFNEFQANENNGFYFLNGCAGTYMPNANNFSQTQSMANATWRYVQNTINEGSYPWYSTAGRYFQWKTTNYVGGIFGRTVFPNNGFITMMTGMTSSTSSLNQNAIFIPYDGTKGFFHGSIPNYYCLFDIDSAVISSYNEFRNKCSHMYTHFGGFGVIPNDTIHGFVTVPIPMIVRRTPIRDPNTDSAPTWVLNKVDNCYGNICMHIHHAFFIDKPITYTASLTFIRIQ